MKKLLICLIAIFTIHSLSAPLTVQASNSSDYISRISFFGDSTTHGMIRYIAENNGRLGKPIVKLSRDQILTPPDGTFFLRNLPTAKIRYRGQVYFLKEAFGKAAPDILIVTVGVNGLLAWEEDMFKDSYRRLLEVISSATPNTQIVLQSVFPIAKERSDKLANFTVEKIDRLNGWIEGLAKEYRLPYLNTASALKDKDGWLLSTCHNGDGMHLNTEGFNRVLAYIIAHPIQKGS